LGGPTSRSRHRAASAARPSDSHINEDGIVDGNDLAIVLGSWSCSRSVD